MSSPASPLLAGTHPASMRSLRACDGGDVPPRSLDQDLDRLDRRMAAAAQSASALIDSADRLAGVGRALHDSAQRHRDVLAVLRAIRDETMSLKQARALARRYLESIR